RGAVAADPATPAGRKDAALAAAPEGAVAAPGRAPLPRVPGRARDLSRVPAGRFRPARAQAVAPGSANAADRSRRRRDAFRLAVRVLAPLRLRRDLHVRGRHARG